MTEVETFQEAFVFALGYGVEVSLAIVLIIAVFVAVIWLFSVPQDYDNGR
jgi:hypothetical protein